MPFPAPFGKYILVEKIASGGMAEVFRAVLRGAAGFEKQLAVKRILPAFSEEPEFVTLFQDEARIASTLAHANIAQVFEFGEIDGAYYLALELVDGLDLAKIMARLKAAGQPMPLATAAFLVAEAARGLAYAHDKGIGIVHRDVSPPNILVSRAGEVKVADFGIAKAAGKVHKTETGVVMGKLRYMSPEQIAAMEELDARSDIFSLGVILYELLAGGPIFQGDQSLRLAELIRTAEIPPPSTRNPAVPPELDAIVLRALSKRREDRYGRAGELARDLSLFVSRTAPGFTREDLAALVSQFLPVRAAEALTPSLEVIPPAAAPTRGHAPPRRRSRAALIFGLAAGAVLIASAALVVTRFMLPGRDVAARPDAAHLSPPADAGARGPEPVPTGAFTLLATVSVDERKPLADAVDRFDVTRRGLAAPDYAAYLTGVDCALAWLVLDKDGRALAAPGLPPLVEALVQKAGVADAVTATVEYVRATGELPLLVKSAARNFLQGRSAAENGGSLSYSAAALAVWLEPGARTRLVDLAYANDLLGRWCEPSPAPVRHFAPLLCERAALIAALGEGDPTARALARWDAAGADTADGGLAVVDLRYEATVNPDSLQLIVELTYEAPGVPSFAAAQVPQRLFAAVQDAQGAAYTVTVPWRVIAPVMTIENGPTLRLRPPPFGGR